MTDNDKDPIEDSWADVNPPLEHDDLDELEKDALIIQVDKFPVEQVTSAGVIYEVAEPEFIGRIPVRTEIEVLSADPPREPLNIRFYEMTSEDCARRDAPENLARLRAQREATDVADRYRSGHAVPYERPDHICYMSIPVLLDLWGTPWNNAAANFLATLNPSAVRVVGRNEGMTADSYSGRVTVALGENNRTISRITQEVEVGGTGFRNGSDARSYLELQEESQQLGRPQSNAFINPRGLRRLELSSEDSDE